MVSIVLYGLYCCLYGFYMVFIVCFFLFSEVFAGFLNGFLGLLLGFFLMSNLGFLRFFQGFGLTLGLLDVHRLGNFKALPGRVT